MKKVEFRNKLTLEDHDIYAFALMAAELKGIEIPAKIQRIEDAITSIIVCRNEIKVEKMHDPDSEMIPILERHMEADEAMVAKLLTEVSFEKTDDPQSLCIQGMLVASSLEARKGFFEEFLRLVS